MSDKLEDFKPFFSVHGDDIGRYVCPTKAFSDDEFSDNDMELMDALLKEHQGSSSNELIELTHSKNRPWYMQAYQMGLLDENGNLIQDTTDKYIDFEMLLDKDSIQYIIFKSSLENHEVFNSLRNI